MSQKLQTIIREDRDEMYDLRPYDGLLELGEEGSEHNAFVINSGRDNVSRLLVG